MEIGKISINFSIIPTGEPTHIWVGDNSDWRGAENLPSVIEITPPGASNPISHTFQKYKLNIFQSVNLAMSCLTICDEQNYEPLSDGVWQFTVKSGYEGIEKTRYYLKTDNIRLELDKIYTRVGLEYDKNDKQFRKDMSDIEFLLRTAEAFAKVGDFYKSQRNFKEVRTLLDKYSECKNCI